MKLLKNSIFFTIVTTILLLFGSIITTSYSNSAIKSNAEYIDITVEQAWDMFNDSSNGIQYPIDVRTDSEWKDEHINTPQPEHARHHCSCEWTNETILMNFILQYEGEEIVIYCRSGGRSAAAATTLIDNGFVGTIYNMLGGIVAWREAGLPTIENRPPDKPIINGPSTGKPEIEHEFTFTVNDPDNDQIYLYVNWSDGTDTIYIGPYESNEEIKIKHAWLEKGDYTINSTAWDIYGEQGKNTLFELSIPKNHKIDKNNNIIFFDKILYILQNILNIIK